MGSRVGLTTDWSVYVHDVHLGGGSKLHAAQHLHHTQCCLSRMPRRPDRLCGVSCTLSVLLVCARFSPPPHPPPKNPPPHHAQAVCEAAKADKARQEWLEAELAGQTSRANASELEKAALQDRVQQLEVSPTQ